MRASFPGFPHDSPGDPNDGLQGLGGATVSATRIREPRIDSRGSTVYVGPLLSPITSADSAGQFSFKDLPPGRYVLCASGAAAQHLRSCLWGLPQVIAEVGSGQTAGGLVLQVRTGVIVNFLVQDSFGKLQSGKRLRLGVYTDQGFYYKAQSKSISGTEYTYSLAVPRDASMRLFLDSEVEVANAGGQVLQNRAPSERIVLPSSGEAVVRLTAR